MVIKYQKRICGTLLDCIDVHIEVSRVEYDKLSDERLGESLEIIQARVEAAHQVQRERLLENELACNADMRVVNMPQYCRLDDTNRSLMHSAMSQMQLSAQAFHRILKLTRKIAALAGAGAFQPTRPEEAIQYRPKYLMLLDWLMGIAHPEF